MIFLTGMATANAGSTGMGDTRGQYGQNGTPVEQTTTPDESPIATQTASASEWDETVLSELADRLGWPSVVVVDGTGKYIIELDISSNEWAQASIRSFSYGTSAETAFNAEQEDARFSGYSVEPTTFYTYAAYTATATGANGSVIERRLRWLVDSRIMGITLYGTSSTILALDTAELGASYCCWQSRTECPSHQAASCPHQFRPLRGCPPPPLPLFLLAD